VYEIVTNFRFGISGDSSGFTWALANEKAINMANHWKCGDSKSKVGDICGHGK
jgi:hypothetical protein